MPLVKRFGYSAALPKQPIGSFESMLQKILYSCRLIKAQTAITRGRSADQNAVRPEHRPVEIDHDPAALRTASIESLQGCDGRRQSILNDVQS